MAITENSLLEYESGQAFNDWEELVDTGDRMVFEASFAPWSGRSGFETTVRPWGVATGGQVTPHTANDTVTVAALGAYMPGAAAADADGHVSVASTEVVVGRAEIDTHLITSITVTAAGALAAVEGDEGTSFTNERGGDGGPPFIPVDSIEVAQVRLSGQSAAVVASTDIFRVVGVHQERYDQPVFAVDPAVGEVHFASPLPAIHVGGTTKRVGARGYTPIFAEMPRCAAFVPADESHSVSSTEIYGGTLGSVSRSLQQASFTHYGNDGHTDPPVQLKNQRLWIRWAQDRNRTPYSLTQGTLGIARQYPAGDHVAINVTISAEQATVDFEG